MKYLNRRYPLIRPMTPRMVNIPTAIIGGWLILSLKASPQVGSEGAGAGDGSGVGAGSDGGVVGVVGRGVGGVGGVVGAAASSMLTLAMQMSPPLGHSLITSICPFPTSVNFTVISRLLTSELTCCQGVWLMSSIPVRFIMVSSIGTVQVRWVFRTSMVKVRLSPTFPEAVSGVMVISQAATGCAIRNRSTSEISTVKNAFAALLARCALSELATVDADNFNNTHRIACYRAVSYFTTI